MIIIVETAVGQIVQLHVNKDAQDVEQDVTDIVAVVLEDAMENVIVVQVLVEVIAGDALVVVMA